MSVQFFEKALASFKKANLERREKLAKASGYANADLYKAFLEGMIGSPSQTISEIKKETKPKVKKHTGKKKTPIIFMFDILDASVSMGKPGNFDSKIAKAKAGIILGLNDLKANKAGVDYRYGISIFSEPSMFKYTAPNKVSESTSIPEFRMGGSTALYDAIGVSLNKLLDMKKNAEYKDAKVLVNIYTDGIENDSREFRDTSKVKELITKAENNGFTITFVGTDSDVQMIQRNINIDASNTLGYDGTAKGLEKAMTATLDSRFVYTSNVVAGKEVTRGFYKTVNKK